jgi:hypothetical protein
MRTPTPACPGAGSGARFVLDGSVVGNEGGQVARSLASVDKHVMGDWLRQELAPHVRQG